MANRYTGSKFNIYDENIKKILKENEGIESIKAVNLLNVNLKSDDRDALSKYIKRNRSRLLDTNEGIYEACEDIKVDFTTAKNIWIKTKNKDGSGVSGFIVNPDYQPLEVVLMNTLQEDLIKNIQEYAPKFPKLKRQKNKQSYLLVIDPADLHIGKLCSAFESGEDYTNQIAVQRALDGVRGILQKVSSFNIDKILFIGGNDILHIDNPKRTTTSGTPQDTDGMWHSNFLIAKQLYVDILEILISVADVHFTFNPSNHDYTNGFFLAQVIETYFKNCNNITFDCTIAHRKGFKYFNNLIGTTHGDGAKEQDLPLLMAQEFAREWSDTKHRYIYTHHVHHKTSKDYIGITVESLRSPSGTDSWHHRNGYQHSPKAVEGFLHCKQNGQIARITHIFSTLIIIFLYF
jgi:hypothetical protein